jgi:hypothetical protein
VYSLFDHILALEGHKTKQEPGNAVVTEQAAPNWNVEVESDQARVGGKMVVEVGLLVDFAQRTIERVDVVLDLVIMNLESRALAW